MFKHALGAKVKDKVSQIEGIAVSRSECLYGCNRYLVQPACKDGQKIPDGWWMDEDQLEVIGEGITAPRKQTGGPMSRTH